MNLNTAIIQHIKKSFSIIDKSINIQAENKKYKILGRQAIAHQGIEPNHRKTKNNKNKNPKPKPKEYTLGVDPKVNKPYQSFLSSLKNSHQTGDEDTTQGKNSTITTYLHTNISTTRTTEGTIETFKFV